MTPLKVKCTICLKEEIPNSEILEEISEMIEKYDLTNEQYLHFLNVMMGKCLNSYEHNFEFDEEFLASINDIVEKYKLDVSEIDKLHVVNEEIQKEIDELLIKIKELQSNYDFNIERIGNLNKSTNDCEVELFDATGFCKIDIWKI